ncbi:MAG: tRNA pseudouridine(38-40) synthase TruA [Acidobacteriota bacterium]
MRRDLRLKMQTWKLTLEYEGTRYSGWQEQANARTVQGELRRAAADLFGRELEIGGAGRTDAGVHAIAQIAHVKVHRRPGDARVERRTDEILRGINDRLPSDINLLSVEEADARFHARHSATARTYLYQISTRRTAFGKRFVWWIKDELNAGLMSEAARVIAGRHDFSAFSERDSSREQSTIVVVESSSVTRDEHLLLFRISASHFLWKMVRRLVGSLVEIGRGNVSVAEVTALLAKPKAAAKFAPARLTAPPSGLFLERITYGSNQLR